MRNKVKIAVVGIGLMGNQHLKAIHLSKKATLHSIVDISDKSRIHAKKFKVPFYKNSNNLVPNLNHKKKSFFLFLVLVN